MWKLATTDSLFDGDNFALEVERVNPMGYTARLAFFTAMLPETAIYQLGSRFGQGQNLLI